MLLLAVHVAAVAAAAVAVAEVVCQESGRHHGEDLLISCTHSHRHRECQFGHNGVRKSS